MSAARPTLPEGLSLFFRGEGEPGFRDLGVLGRPRLEAEIETRPRLRAEAGERRVAGGHVARRDLALSFAFESPNSANLRAALMGAAEMAVAAGDRPVADEILRLTGTAPVPLALDPGPAPQIDSVTSLDGQTSYQAGADWEAAPEAGGLRRVADGAISDGAEVLVAYRWAAPDHGRAAVMTRPRAVGSARLVLRPRAGVNLFWEIPRCALAPAGSVIFDAEAWLALPMRLELLTVGDSDPAAPFGEMRRWSV